MRERSINQLKLAFQIMANTQSQSFKEDPSQALDNGNRPQFLGVTISSGYMVLGQSSIPSISLKDQVETRKKK